MFIGERNCKLCNAVFEYTKHQKSKLYCTNVCHRKANYTPRFGKAGRPKVNV